MSTKLTDVKDEWRAEPLAIHGWRVVEVMTGREVVNCIYREEDAAQVVADHNARALLVAALHECQIFLEHNTHEQHGVYRSLLDTVNATLKTAGEQQ